MADAVADFKARVDSSRRDTRGSESARVLVNEAQLVVVFAEAEQQVLLDGIFDLSENITRNTTEGEDWLTIALRDGEIRETLTIEGSTTTMSSFQTVLFRLLFDGISVEVQTKHRAASRSSSDVTLELTQSAIQFETEGDGVAIGHESIAGFETRRKAHSGEERPVALLYWADERHDAKTTVVFPSFRLLNLFGRYLQAYTTLTGGPSSDGAAQLLLVDDDRYDLEMAEMLLQEQTSNLTIETRTSAGEGMDVLAGDATIHCIVSDYDMPGTDGIEFLSAVREQRPDLPFILFTGQGSEAVAKQAIISDATDYVEKGIGSKQYEILARRIKGSVT